jgi:hypothetical protein
MSAPEKPDLESILRLLFRFLDLSRDLDRNRDDTMFADQKGRIAYVLDENVFEIFVRPFDPRGAQASLHSRYWAGSQPELPERRQDHASFAAQAALLTSEYLFSGELPGQADVRLFMTEWHGWELARRVQALNAEYGRRLKEVSEDELAKPFEALRMVLRNLSGGVSDAATIRAVDPNLEADLADLKGDSLDVHRSFISTRLSVKILAENRDVEPAEQLERIVTKPIRGRVQRLHLTYRPPPQDRGPLEQDARRWMDRLLAECSERRIAVVDGLADGADRCARVRAALWDDARSLALIRWAAVRGIKESERLVFVTADNLLFDTYRRWYAGLERDSAEYLEPFVLRRIIQYAPIFNLSDSRNVLGDDVRVFFGQLQSVLEITMLPLNLSRLRSTAGEEVLTRMREMTALRLLDEKPIHSDPRYADLARALERKEFGFDLGHLENLLEQWRRLERASLGLAGEYVRARLNEKQRKLEDLKLMTEGDEASAKAAFKRYLGQLIERLFEGSREIWLPLAREFIDSWEPRPGHVSRAPIPFQLELSVGNRTISLGQILDRRLSGGDSAPIVPPDAWPALLEAPDIVFAIAACLALVSDDWSDADHFADMAQRADQARSARPMDGSSQLRQVHELRYLNALTKRFRIGVLAPPLNVDGESKVRHGHLTARELLDSCVNFHEGLEEEPLHRLRLIRALSERAALDLFYAVGLAQKVRIAAVSRLPLKDRTEAAWAEFKRSGQDGESPEDAAGRRLDEARRVLADAEADLRRCLQCEAALASHERNAELFKKLEQQFLVNIAAAAVLARLIDHSAPSSALDGKVFWRVANETVIRRIRRLLESGGAGGSGLFRAELLAFLSLCGDAAAHEQLKAIGSASTTGKALNLDLALLDAIRTAANSDLFRPRAHYAATLSDGGTARSNRA